MNTLVPATPAGVALTGDGKVKIYVLDSKGNYGDVILWYGTKQVWGDANGVAIENGDVVIENGCGFALNNSLKVDAAGKESTARNAQLSPASITVSGQVDLVCANVVPTGYSINGNSTPVAFDLTDIVPQTPAGVAITGDGKIKIYTLDSKGNYGDVIVWAGTKESWVDSSSQAIEKGTVALAPGAGFAVNNSLKVDAAGKESTARNAVASAAILKLPSPIK